MKKVKLILIILSLLIIIPGISYAKQVLPTDISNHWAEADIKTASQEGWAYLENDKFSPNKEVTREEAVWMLIGACKTVRVENFDINTRADLSGFKDKSSVWAEGRMEIAVGNELIKGYPDGTIRPKAPITRAEFAALLSRRVNEGNTPVFSPFWDYIPQWAIDGIKKVYGLGIIKGYSDGTYKSSKSVTKAEALVMIKRWKERQPEIILGLCPEYTQIQSNISNTEVTEDGKMLKYYGTEGKRAKYDTGKFYIEKYSETGFMINLSDYQEETYNDLQKVLEAFVNINVETVTDEIIALEYLSEKELNFNEKTITIKSFPVYTIINISYSE